MKKGNYGKIYNMEITLNLVPLLEFFSQSADVVLLKMLLTVGWLPISIVFLWGFAEIWLDYIQTRWSNTVKYTLLAIDIPRGNEQSPKAVENIFSYLAGAHGSINLIEKWWEGKVQVGFSLEIASIDGYTQFLIRTPIPFKDLVESAIYSQYPDAEITEVNDYTEWAPTKYPDDEYDVYGIEFIQKTTPAYPIRTYKEFEHQFVDPKLMYKDPMATLMDLCSSLKKGEQLWYQIILVPIGFEWTEIGDKEVSKLLNEKKNEDHLGDKIIAKIILWLEKFSEAIYTLWGDIEDKKEDKKDEPFKMMNLKPKQKKQVEMIHEKVSKLGFEFKIRFVYIARKDVMNKPKVVNGFVGYMKQFADLDLNNLKPDMDITATRAQYFFTEYRLREKQRKIVSFYKSRHKTGGRKRGILNIEELATIWHFPVESAVRAPLIQKASRRKSEPPMALPVSETAKKTESSFQEEIFDVNLNNNNIYSQKELIKKEEGMSGSAKKEITDLENAGEKSGMPPANLPIG